MCCRKSGCHTATASHACRRDLSRWRNRGTVPSRRWVISRGNISACSSIPKCIIRPTGSNCSNILRLTFVRSNPNGRPPRSSKIRWRGFAHRWEANASWRRSLAAWTRPWRRRWCARPSATSWSRCLWTQACYEKTRANRSRPHFGSICNRSWSRWTRRRSSSARSRVRQTPKRSEKSSARSSSAFLNSRQNNSASRNFWRRGRSTRMWWNRPRRIGTKPRGSRPITTWADCPRI